MSLPVNAEPLCGKRGSVLGKHDNLLSEKPTALGLNKDGGVVEILTSPDGDTWTIIVTTPDGISCRMASGRAWQAKPQHVVGAGA